ncbi:hypothetical protein VNO78_26138 [Psophocarpus tetragonolobus]|uniref:Uncharacterized protein n=1 Tax=Psophocarpus tetragonolobus TaxID=3891 RepID=A0AAN9S1H0_PSOTE
MRMLDLSNNIITGHLPNCWEHLNSLEFLDLRNNKLSGKIPPSMGTLVNLQALVLRNNNIIGEPPFSLKNCTSLTILDMSENLLFGPIPSWIGENLQQLKILSLRVNGFFGRVPSLLCHLSEIQVLDLSRNKLSGGIPTCLSNFTVMKQRRVITRQIKPVRKITTSGSYLDLYESNLLLMWKGQDHEFFNPENLLTSIDISSNHFTAEIPKVIGCLIGLVSLNLSGNNLNGKIPSEIGNLSSLEFLDLSRNLFNGKIPSTFYKIDRLGVLDLSNNELSGRIPFGRQLQTFDASSFEGNANLCGQQINKSCPRDMKTENPQVPTIDADENSIFYGALYISLGLGFFTGFWTLSGSLLLWQPWRIAYLRFLNKVRDYIIVVVEVNITKWRMWLEG